MKDWRETKPAKGGPAEGNCFREARLRLIQPLARFLRKSSPLTVSPRSVCRAEEKVRSEMNETKFLHFTDFHQLPAALFADVISTGADQRELSPSHIEAIMCFALTQ